MARINSLLVAFAAFGFAAAAGAAEPEFPLKVAPSGRFLVDQRGAPFFVNGDTAWALTHNLTYDEAVRYLQNRKAKGINAVIVSVPDAYGPDGSHNDPPDRQGQRPFVGNDVTRPNEPYWKHVDRVLTKAHELGILVLYFPAYLGCCSDGYSGLFKQNGVDRSRAYGRFVGERHGRLKNIIWVHGGDAGPGDARDVVAAVQEGIAAVDTTHLHTAHWGQDMDSYGPFGERWLDLYGSYTYGGVASTTSRHVDHKPRKPVILLESHYENDFQNRTATDVRKYPYRAVLSGAAGHFFGNKPLWYCGTGWEAALDLPGSQAIGHAGRLFRSRPWYDLVPDRDHTLVTAGFGDAMSDAGVQAARASDGSFAMAFLPSQRSITVDLGRITGTMVRAWWFDVATGQTTDTGTFPARGTRAFSPPRAGDVVLVLDAAERNFPVPGSADLPAPPAAVPAVDAGAPVARVDALVAADGTPGVAVGPDRADASGVRDGAAVAIADAPATPGTQSQSPGTNGVLPTGGQPRNPEPSGPDGSSTSAPGGCGCAVPGAPRTARLPWGLAVACAAPFCCRRRRPA